MATLTLVGLAAAATAAWYGGSKAVSEPEERYRPPASTLEALGLLARVSMWSLSESVARWRPADLTLGLLTTTRREGRAREHLEELREEADEEDGFVEVGTDVEWRDTVLLLLKLLAYSTLLARSRKEPNCINALRQKLGLDAKHVLAWQLRSGMFRPAYLLVADEELREIVLVVRGTYTMKDTVTCLLGTTVPHHIIRNVEGPEEDVEVVMGYAHGGMLTAARWLHERVAEPLAAAMDTTHRNWGIRLVGHSLGGGTAFLLCSMLRSDPRFAHARCVAFAAPACVTRELAETAAEFTTTVVFGEDPVPSLCPYTIKSLRLEVLRSAWYEELKQSMGDSFVFRTAMSVGSSVGYGASSASTLLFSAARMTGKAARITRRASWDAVMSATNFSRKIAAPLCSTTSASARIGMASAAATSGVVLYRLPSDAVNNSQNGTDGGEPHDDSHGDGMSVVCSSAPPQDGRNDDSNNNSSDDDQLSDDLPPEMTAPAALHFEELDENIVAHHQAANEEEVRLTEDMVSALNLHVSQADLYTLAEKSVPSNAAVAPDEDSDAQAPSTQSTDADDDDDGGSVRDAVHVTNDASHSGDQNSDIVKTTDIPASMSASPVADNTEPRAGPSCAAGAPEEETAATNAMEEKEGEPESEEEDLAQKMQSISDQLEVTEPRMYPPGWILHVLPRAGPDAWDRPDKLAEPSYWGCRDACEETGEDRDNSAEKPKEQCDDGVLSSPPPREHNDEDDETNDIPAWLLYAGVPAEYYGASLKLSRSMTRDHCQYTYDAALAHVLRQMIDQ